jgi:hypothetical protein
MVHVPYNARPLPPGAMGTGPRRPTPAPEVPVTDTPPVEDKPVIKKKANPRRRSFGKKTKMRSMISLNDIAEWDVSPKKIHNDMKLG